MWSCEDYVIAYCKRIYGMRLLGKNGKFYLETTGGTYRIDRHLSHEQIYLFHNVDCPLTLTETNLGRAFFKLAAFSTYKEIGIVPSQKDWEKFLNDAYKYGNYKEITNV